MNDELIAAAELGEEARSFKKSDLYRVMCGFAEQEVMEAQDALLDVPATDADKIRDLQNKAKLGNMFKSWIDELIDEGDNAISVFQQQRAA